MAGFADSLALSGRNLQFMTHLVFYIWIHIKSKIAIVKSAFGRKKKKTFHQQILLKLRNKLMKCYIWSIALYGAETWTVRKVYQK
jgi:hypothetical protein